MNTPSISAIIIAYNAEDTIKKCILSLKNQTVRVSEIIIIDDASTDSTADICKILGCNVFINPANMGRGYSRNIGIKKASSDIILFCDSTNELPKDYLFRSLKYFSSNNIAAIFGNIKNSSHLKDPLSRWRARHLFREDQIPSLPSLVRANNLNTYGVVMQKNAITKVGNFKKSLRMCEDIDLGEKLIKNGYQIYSDPSIFVYSNKRETIKTICSRYNRWFSNHKEESSPPIKTFLSNLNACYFIYLKKDIKVFDISSALFTTLFPFIFLFYNLFMFKHFER